MKIVKILTTEAANNKDVNLIAQLMQSEYIHEEFIIYPKVKLTFLDEIKREFNELHLISN